MCISEAPADEVVRTLRGESILSADDLEAIEVLGPGRLALCARHIDAIEAIGPERLALCAELCGVVGAMNARHESSVDAGFDALRAVLKKLLTRGAK